MSTTIETRLATIEARLESILMASANKDLTTTTAAVKSVRDHLTDLIDELLVSGVALTQAAWSGLEAACTALRSLWNCIVDSVTWCWNKIRALAAAVAAGFSTFLSWAAQKTAPAPVPAP